MDLMRSVSMMALAIGASMAVGASAPAHAIQTVSFNLNAPTSSSSGAFDSVSAQFGSLSFNRFNPALGTLTGVVFSLANEVTSTHATISGNFSGGEGGNATALNSSRFRVADRAVEPGATNVFDSNGAATSFCSTFGGSCSNANNSSETQPIFPASVTLSLPTDLSGYIDNAVDHFFPMWLFMSQTTSLQGCFGGTCIAEGRSSWQGDLTVEFLFDPAAVPVSAPATLALLGASLIGLGAARRRRA